jgi:hypothetical protein
VKLGIRAKLFAASLALIVVSLATDELYLRPAIENDPTGVGRFWDCLDHALHVVQRGSNLKATRDELFEIGFDFVPRGLGNHFGHPRLVHVGEVAKRPQSEADVFAWVLAIPFK